MFSIGTKISRTDLIAGSSTTGADVNRILTVLKSYLAYFRFVLQRRAKAAADEEEDPFIYPHS